MTETGFSKLFKKKRTVEKWDQMQTVKKSYCLKSLVMRDNLHTKTHNLTFMNDIDGIKIVLN